MTSALFLVTLCALLLACHPSRAADNRLLPLNPTFLAALRYVECGNRRPPIIGDGGAALGPYQIHRAYWSDAVDFDCTLGGDYADCARELYARRVVTAYLNRYARDAIVRSDFRTLACIHHLGPRWRPTFTAGTSYWRAVSAVLRQRDEIAQKFFPVRASACDP